MLNADLKGKQTFFGYIAGPKAVVVRAATPKQAFNYTLESLYKTQVGSHFHHITSEP